MSLFDQINTADNSNEETAKEKHLPALSVKKLADNRFEVHVNVGGGKHPNEIDHWIQWAGLRINDCFIGRAEFSAKIMDPVCSFIITPDKLPLQLSVIARCNKHGIWKSDCTLA
jgi:desulfoferrodoxin-like iron-binding protein